MNDRLRAEKKRLLDALAMAIVVVALWTPAEAQEAAVPDDALTPGEIASTDVSEVCGYVNGLSYSKRHRHTTREMKLAVIREYHAPLHMPSEIDHRVELSLGGADTLKNLWYQPAPDYRCKDHLEDLLWKKVCRERAMSLADAQAVFLGDWRVGYTLYVGDLGACLTADRYR